MPGERATKSVYLDHAATTPVDPDVARVMHDVLARGSEIGNPASTHVAGRRAAVLVEDARRQLARLLHTEPALVTFTSGATESINVALLGAARHRAHRGRHLVTMRTEHKAVADVFAALERDGFDVTWLLPDAQGVLDPATLESAMREDTQLVSIMHVNNETGVIQDIEALGRVCRDHDVLFHCDAAQSAGKLELDLARLPVDMLSITAHKFHGPQGVGALYLADRAGCYLQPLMYGGGQERRLRPGTLPVHQVAGFGRAAALSLERAADDVAHFRSLNERLWRGIADIPGILRNGGEEVSFPGILNVSAENVEGESLLLALQPLCVASGSACNAQSREPSHVLRALGRTDRQAQSAIRFSFGRETSESDVDAAIHGYRQAVEHLRNLAPAVETSS